MSLSLSFLQCHLSLFVFLIFLRLFSNALSQQTAATKYFLDKAKVEVLPFSLETARNGKLPTSNLDVFAGLVASIKYFLTQQYNRDYEINYKYIVSTGKLQQPISTDVPFPCALNNTRSSTTPHSVHELRPGDIDVIAAMGDSLTIGSGMMAKTLPQLLVEFRGQTFLGGGLEDWRTMLTLPNILKVFNPNLYGYAVANTLAKFREARFIVAEPFAMVQDMPYMAEVLIERMQSDPNVNMKNDWKMISLHIGSNDVCNGMCLYDKSEDFIKDHRRDLYRTLTILRDNIPRLMVNVVVFTDLYTVLHSMVNKPIECDILHKVACHCLFGRGISSKQLQARHRIVQRIQKIDEEISSLPEFQLEEFAVVPQTFTVNKSFPKSPQGHFDMKFFAMDCFHFSQYGNAAISTDLWNNMLQVKTKKSPTFLRPFQLFACPNEEKPYIRTLKNSPK